MSLDRALRLAAAAPGRAYPKPTVGAVLVSGGAVVAEGVTEAGGRHAEAVVLDEAGERARGATLYVTMEPCAHWGTTPPCTEAAISAGVACVVAGEDVSPESLDAYCLGSEALARFKRPREYRFVDALPKSPSGKILRRMLREEGARP